MDDSPTYLDIYDFRRRVLALYRQRDDALLDGQDPIIVHDRFRLGRDELFAHHPQSALSPAARDRFQPLDYFPYNAAACVAATLELDPAPTRIASITSGEHGMPMVRIAELYFSFQGVPANLALYWIDVYGGGLFLPFRDATAPAETYGGGRYLFDTIKGSDFMYSSDGDGKRSIVLDFNYAYNPSCAYDHRWICPLAPMENWLPFPIRAGERQYET